MKIGLKNTRLVLEKIDKGKIRRLVEEIICRENKRLGEIEIVFLKDPEILKINKKFLNHDYFTDVITFSYNKKDKISGDVCISIDSIERNALKYKVIKHLELMRVIIHGVLHLIGFDDKNKESKRKMKEKENFYLGMYLSTENECNI